MATSESTAQALTKLVNLRGHKLAWVILFEGVGLAFTTSEDVAGISAAWLHSPWQATPGGGKGDPIETAKWYQTANYPKEFKQSIDFFKPKIPSDGNSFTIGDPDDSLAAVVFAQNRQAAKTYLTIDMGPADTVITAQTTTPFVSFGSGQYYLYLGNETLSVLGSDRTATGWSFCFRGRWPFHHTSSGSEFSTRHVGNQVNANDVKISSAPNTWYNRRCRIFLHHYEPSTGWSSYTQAMLWWEGLLRNPVDNGDRTITFNAVCVAEALKANLFESQFTAEAAEGLYFSDWELYMAVHEDVNGLPNPFDNVVSLGSAGQYTAAQLLTAIKLKLVKGTIGTTYQWDCGRSQEGRIRFTVTSPYGLNVGATASRSNFTISMSQQAFVLLGFSSDDFAIIRRQLGTTVNDFAVATISFKGSIGSPTVIGYWERTAPKPPVLLALPSLGLGDDSRQIRLQNIQGTWSPQFVLFGDQNWAPLTEGYLKIGDMVIVGGYFDAPSSTFIITQTVADQFKSLGFFGTGIPTTADHYGLIHEGESLTKIPLQQIWYERDSVKDIMLRLLLSTGETNFNSLTWDKNPATMGMGIPYDLLDIPSFLSLGNLFYTHFLTEPTEASKIIESMLSTFGRHLMWRQGVLSLVEPRIDGPTIATGYSLDEKNKAREDDRVSIVQSTDGVINRIELKYQRDLSGAFQSTIPFEDVVSSSDYGKKTAVEVEAWGIANMDGVVTFAQKVVAKVLAFFSRPMCSVPRTTDKSLMLICPGDTVLLSDPYVMNPKTGIRGIANWPCFVKSAGFDPQTLSGSVELCFSGDTDVDKICPWAPSARVNEIASNAGYVVVDGTHRYIAIKDFSYMSATDPTGPECFYFNAGDNIIIRELSPVDPRNPLIIHATISTGIGQGVDRTPGAAKLFLTATIGTWDNTKLYVVTPDVITTVTTPQLGSGSYIADDATDTTGRLPADAYVWGFPKLQGVTTPPVMNQPFVKLPIDGSIDGQGRPLAVADIWEAMQSLNCARAYKTRSLGWTQNWNSNPAFTTTAARELLAGPIWIPLYRRGARGLQVWLRTKAGVATGTIQFFASTSRLQPMGQATSGPTSVTFIDRTIGTISDSYVASLGLFTWRNLGVLPCYPDADARPPGVWVTIEGFTGTTGVSAVLGGVSIYEDHG